MDIIQSIFDLTRSVWVFFSEGTFFIKIISALTIISIFLCAVIYRPVLFDHFLVRGAGFIWRVHLFTLNGKNLNPIDGAVLCEVIGKRGDTPVINAYDLKVSVGKKWIPLNIVNLQKTEHIYWTPHALDQSIEIQFTDLFFNEVAERKNLQPGESISGWIFFTVPHESKSAYRSVIDQSPSSFKLTIQDPQGRSEKHVLNLKRQILMNPVTPYWGFKKINGPVNLSKMDLSAVEYKIKQ